MNASGGDLIAREDRVYDIQPTAARMALALQAAGAEVPPYLSLLAAEASDSLSYATFAMF